MSEHFIYIFGTSGCIGTALGPRHLSLFSNLKIITVDNIRNNRLGHLEHVSSLNFTEFYETETQEKNVGAIILSGATKPKDILENYIIVHPILKKLKQLKADRVLVASSSAVYGDALDRAFKECDSCSPKNLYGQSKLLMETKLAHEFQDDFKQLSFLRIGNIFGCDGLSNGLERLKSRDTLKLPQFKNGKSFSRCYCFPEDLLTYLLVLAYSKILLPSVVNLSNTYPIYFDDLLNHIRHKVTYFPYENPAEQFIHLDVRVAMEILDSLSWAGINEPACKQLEKAKRLYS